ncbi:hypothetical protein SCRDD08_00856 [Streptococcus cristatus]|uniref:Uncharacterized protein n=1 Tax=Streptococcus cristatus TaxID=45634 RepID=A0A139N236_STRCR|nr:hypothetical protein SCRDD08_00856 [Streptococcus cristatus]
MRFHCAVFKQILKDIQIIFNRKIQCQLTSDFLFIYRLYYG